MLIDFVHLGDAYLPELQAYRHYIEGLGHGVRLHRRPETIPPHAEVIWWICGLVPHMVHERHATAFHIHEYASASVPPWAWAKDRLKRIRQPRPGYRIFQNEWVRHRMGFTDSVPFELRDMGLAPAFLAQAPAVVAPDHDDVYLGEMSRLRHFLPVFEALGQLGRRVLLVGAVPDELSRAIDRLADVTVTGRVPHHEVPAMLRRARVGLNLVPSRAPYAFQTSTKMLEYCAAGLHVLSTDYPWVRDFAARHHWPVTFLPSAKNGPALRDAIGDIPATHRSAALPSLQALAWPRLLEQLGVWRTIGLRP